MMTKGGHALLWICLVFLATASAKVYMKRRCNDNFFYDAWYDMTQGIGCKEDDITFVRNIKGDNGCDQKGVLNISLASVDGDPDRRAVMIDFFFNENPWGFSFHVGDSVSNGGYGGDANHQEYDAEIHPVDNTSMRIYHSEKKGGAHTIENAIRDRLTLFIKDGKLVWITESGPNFYENPGLFALNGQLDAVAGNTSNYQIYLGINRIVKGKGRHRYGSGLCKVGIRYLADTNSFYDSRFDLKNGDTCNDNSYITEYEALTGTGCDTEGVLKIEFASLLGDLSRRQILIDLFFGDYKGMAFDIGDSKWNDGWGGDNNQTIYNAEINPLVKQNGFRIYHNQKKAGSKKTLKYSFDDYGRLTFVIKDKAIQWISSKVVGDIYGASLFGLDGQSNNYDIYVGLNRVIYDHFYDRDGSGLCMAAFRFLPEVGGIE